MPIYKSEEMDEVLARVREKFVRQGIPLDPVLAEAEVRAWVAEHAAGDDPVLRREMEAALEPEWISLLSEGLSVDFPLGSLPSQETAYGWFEEYEKAPGAVLQPWAIPDSPEDAG